MRRMRFFWSRLGVTMALAMPVSSSRLRNTNPLAVPGRWRAITHPPMRRRWPLGMDLRVDAGWIPSALNSARRYGQTRAVEVGDQAFFVGHGSEWGGEVGLREFFQQRAGAAHGLLDLPEGVAAVESQFRISSFGFRVGMGRGSVWVTRNLKLKT
jgi:hypothetical protein